MRQLLSSPTRRSIMKMFGPMLCRSRPHKFWDEFVEDLLKSAWLTLVVYAVCFALLYASVRFSFISDPSQSIECHPTTIDDRRNTSRNDLVELTRIVQSVMDKADFQSTTFVCYSTLFELLHQGKLSPDSQRFEIFLIWDSQKKKDFNNFVFILD